MGSKFYKDSTNYYPTKKAISIISFKPQNYYSNCFFSKNSILKFSDDAIKSNSRQIFLENFPSPTVTIIHRTKCKFKWERS